MHKAPSPHKPNARRAPGAGEETVICRDHFSSTPARYLQDLEDLDADIETALEYEKHLARKQYRLRQLILNMKAKRDHLADLGDLLTERRHAA